MPIPLANIVSCELRARLQTTAGDTSTPRFPDKLHASHPPGKQSKVLDHCRSQFLSDKKCCSDHTQAGDASGCKHSKRQSAGMLCYVVYVVCCLLINVTDQTLFDLQTAKPVTSAGTPQQQQLDSTARMCTQQYRLPETAADNLLPPASTTASSQNKATTEQKTQQLQQADPPQTSVSMKSHFDVRFPVQASTKQDSAHRAPELKQAPTKREKIQCLFCTKPARIT